MPQESGQPAEGLLLAAVTPATWHSCQIYLPSCKTACNLFSPSRKVSQPTEISQETHTHTHAHTRPYNSGSWFFLTPACNRRRSLHAWNDTWTAFKQVESPSGSKTWGSTLVFGSWRWYLNFFFFLCSAACRCYSAPWWDTVEGPTWFPSAPILSAPQRGSWGSQGASILSYREGKRKRKEEPC